MTKENELFSTTVNLSEGECRFSLDDNIDRLCREEYFKKVRMQQTLTAQDIKELEDFKL